MFVLKCVRWVSYFTVCHMPEALTNPILQGPREPTASTGTSKSPVSWEKDIGHWNEKFRTTFGIWTQPLSSSWANFPSKDILRRVQDHCLGGNFYTVETDEKEHANGPGECGDSPTHDVGRALDHGAARPRASGLEGMKRSLSASTALPESLPSKFSAGPPWSIPWLSTHPALLPG